jgi:hypothetical protein
MYGETQSLVMNDYGDPFTAIPTVETYNYDISKILSNHGNDIKMFKTKINVLIFLVAFCMLISMASLLTTVGWNSSQQFQINSNDNSINTLDTEVEDLNVCTEEFCENPDIINEIENNVTSLINSVNVLDNCTEELCENPNIISQINTSVSVLLTNVSALEECTGEFCQDPEIFKNITEIVGTVNALVNCTEDFCANPGFFTNITNIAGEVQALENCTQELCNNPNIFTEISSNFSSLNASVDALNECTEELCENPNIISELENNVTSLINSVEDLNNCTEELCNNPNIFAEISENTTSINNTLQAHINNENNPHDVTIDQVSPTTTKGDIMVDDGTNVVRFPVGTDGQILSSNSATTEGIDWVDMTLSDVSGTGDQTLIGDGTGVELTLKKLSEGTGVSLSSDVNQITITNSEPASSVTVSDVSPTGDESIIGDGVGPDLTLKKITGGTQISVTADSNQITIDNDSPATSVTNTDVSATGDETLIGDGTGPALTTKKLSASTGILLSSDANQVIITNSDPASDVSLADVSATGEESIIGDGTGPDLTVKKFTGGTAISVSSDVNQITIDNDSPATSVTLADVSATGDETLIGDGTGPDLTTKKLTAGTGISFSSDSNQITITNDAAAGSVTLSDVSATGEESIIGDGVGPDLTVKKFTGGTGVSVSSDADQITITSDIATNTNDTQILFNSGDVITGNDLLRFDGNGNFLYGDDPSGSGSNSFIVGHESTSLADDQVVIGRVDVTGTSGGGVVLAACLPQNPKATFIGQENIKFWSRNGGSYDNSFHFHAGVAGSLKSMYIVEHIADLTISYLPANPSDFSGPVSNMAFAMDDTAATLTDHVNDMANPHDVTIDQVSPTTTLGDIMVDDGTNVVRLPLGDDNFQVMFSNFSSPTGITWGFVDSFYVLFNMPATWTDWWPGVVGTFISTAFQNLSVYLSDHVLQQGTFTPTFTDISGTSARASGDVVYTCIGEVCTVAMRCDFTLTATTFSVDIDTSSLPITNVFSCSGTGSAGTGSLTNAHVNDAAGACRISGRAGSTGAVSFFITFMYR